jgi:hypothetical protein
MRRRDFIKATVGAQIFPKIDVGNHVGRSQKSEKITCPNCSNVDARSNDGIDHQQKLFRHAVDKLMLDLIEDMGGTIIRSGLWT